MCAPTPDMRTEYNLTEYCNKLLVASLMYGHRERGKPENSWRRDLEKDTWTAGFKYSWRKMEATAQDRAGWMERPMFH